MSATVEGTVRVSASRAYDVVVGRGLVDEVGPRLRAAVPGCDGTALLVSDSNVAGLYADRVGCSLVKAGFTVEQVTVQAGEASKCLDAYRVLLEAAAARGLTRASAVVAVGGGVVGDLAGFAAATYMRGCHLVQVATSLLAMVDSSVGGKTAVDLPQGKNLAGAFHQPDLVLCDLDCLATLPDEYVSDGLGEVAKYAIMADPELFGWLQGAWEGQEARVVERCVAIKRDVVEADEREGGVRKLLNLGHTVGHGIELLSGYTVPHGHAVAAGTAIMARACAAKGWCPAEDARRIEGLLRGLGLPTASRRSAADLAAAAAHDKKRTGGSIDVVAVLGVGKTEVRRMTLDEFAELVALGWEAPAGAAYAEAVPGAVGARGEGLALGWTLGAPGFRDPLAPVDGKEPLTATVRPGTLSGTVEAISSKSAAHRLLVCAALADAPTRIRCTTTSRDIEATCDCLRALGARIERDGDVLAVTPVGMAGDEREPGDRDGRYLSWNGVPQLPCGESGSTLRFLLPVACALGNPASFSASGRLPQRPLEPLRTRLVEHGCQVSPQFMPDLQVWGRLRGGDFDLPGDVSSQYATGLLLALPLTGEGGRVRLHGTVESRPYIDMTLAALRAFGVEVAEAREPDGAGGECTVFAVPAGARYTSPGAVAVEGDWSNAAFWLVAGALSGEPVTVAGLDLATDQGDLAVLDVLGAMGAHVRVHPGEGWARACGRDPETGAPLPLHGVEIDARDVPDLVPVLCVVAACTEGDTRVVNAGRLRLKESDRIATTADLLRRLGVEVEEGPEGLVVHGRGSAADPFAPCLSGGRVLAHGDHRIAMAAAVAATRAAGPVEVCGADAVAKSYPGFFADLALLGGAAELVRTEAQGALFPDPERGGAVTPPPDRSERGR